MSHFSFHINKSNAGKTVLTFLQGRISKMGPERLQVALHRGMIEKNESVIHLNDILISGDELKIDCSYFLKPRIFPENIPLRIVYEDDAIILVNKEAGMACHAGLGVYSGTLLNALKFHYENKGEKGIDNGLVHRLDRATCGLILCAKTATAFRDLSFQVKQGQLKREYFAGVIHKLPELEGKIEANIGRDPDQHDRIWVNETGKKAITHFSFLEEKSGKFLYRCKTEYGRTHQVRIHLAWMEAPIIGDKRYDGEIAEQLHLCSSRISFKYPGTSANWEFAIEHPEFW